MSNISIMVCLMVGVLCGVIGIFVGFIFCHWFSKTDGTLNVYLVEDDEETTESFRLDFDTSLDDIPKKDFVIFRVQVNHSRKKLTV